MQTAAPSRAQRGARLADAETRGPARALLRGFQINGPGPCVARADGPGGPRSSPQEDASRSCPRGCSCSAPRPDPLGPIPRPRSARSHGNPCAGRSSGTELFEGRALTWIWIAGRIGGGEARLPGDGRVRTAAPRAPRHGPARSAVRLGGGTTSRSLQGEGVLLTVTSPPAPGSPGRRERLRVSLGRARAGRGQPLMCSLPLRGAGSLTPGVGTARASRHRPSASGISEAAARCPVGVVGSVHLGDLRGVAETEPGLSQRQQGVRRGLHALPAPGPDSPAGLSGPPAPRALAAVQVVVSSSWEL